MLPGGHTSLTPFVNTSLVSGVALNSHKKIWPSILIVFILTQTWWNWMVMTFDSVLQPHCFCHYPSSAHRHLFCPPLSCLSSLLSFVYPCLGFPGFTLPSCMFMTHEFTWLWSCCILWEHLMQRCWNFTCRCLFSAGSGNKFYTIPLPPQLMPYTKCHQTQFSPLFLVGLWIYKWVGWVRLW